MKAAHSPEAVLSVRIPTDGAPHLEGLVGIPAHAAGVVLFAHGSGSSRLSPRNAAVARALRDAGFGTVLFDLLREDEASERANVFDISLLSHRLRDATVWARQQDDLRGLPIGYFGASTGAAATLAAAATDPEIAAIVSRGGRPDLAGPALGRVRAPTLLIVGGADLPVLRLNEQAYKQLRCEKELWIVPEASHLFEESGALEQVTDLARRWFGRHLTAAPEHG